MGQLNLFVGGMSCRRCVREVTALVRDVPGVETISANAGDCMVRLTGSMQAALLLRLQPHGDDIRTGAMGDDSGETAVGKPSR